MFERFTERARKAVVLAQEEAVRFGHDYLGTEHILIGLLGEGEGVAAQTLHSLNVTIDGVREQVEGIAGSGERRTGLQIPFTPYAKKVLELALRQAMQLNHNYIGTEHILLGLVVGNEGIAARILSSLGVDPKSVRREVLQRLGKEPEVDPPEEVVATAREGNRTLLRGRISSLQVHLRVGGRSRRLLMDLDYEYEAANTEEMDQEDLPERVVETLEGREYRSVEEGILEVGRLVLDRFPAVHEVEISAVRERFLERHTSSGISVSRTFRR